MNELYTEKAVKKGPNMKDTLLKCGIVTVDAMLFICGFFFLSTAAIFAGIVAVTLTIYFFPMMKVEYEYIFCDGQFDFDKIMGGNKRKNMLKIDMEESEIIAPMGSHALDGYTYQKLEVKKYISGDKDAKVYVLVGKDKKNQMVKIFFEPSEKMLRFAKQKSPRKVVEY